MVVAVSAEMKLTYINLCECDNSDISLQALSSHCGCLQHLGLDCCPKLSVLGVAAVAKGCGALTESATYPMTWYLQFLTVPM